MKMNKSKLVSTEIFKEIFQSYLPRRIEELSATDPNKVDPPLSPIFTIYQNASDNEKNAIKNFAEVIAADIASTILGGLDGCTDLGSLSEDFTVQYGTDKVTPYLQDYFLEQVELMYENQ